MNKLSEELAIASAEVNCQAEVSGLPSVNKQNIASQTGIKMRTDNTSQTTNKVVQPMDTLVHSTKALMDTQEHTVPVNAVFYMFLVDASLKLTE